MAIEKQINIVVKETGIDSVNKKVSQLDTSLEGLQTTQKGLAKSMGESSNSVLENGGAMGLLNDATGGLAMTVKDAVEATALFAKNSKLAAMAQAFYTTVVGTSTGAMKLFRIALISTGIGAIVVGIGLLIANFDKVKKVVLNLVPGLAIIGDLFTSLVETVGDFIGVTSDASRELDKLVEQSEKTIRKNQDFLDTQGDKYDEYTKRKIQANIDFSAKVKEVSEDETRTEAEKTKYLKGLRDKADREILDAENDRNDKLSKSRKDAQDKIDDENTKAKEKRDAANEKLAEEEKAKAQKLIDEAKAINANAIEENNIRSKTELELLEEKYLAEKTLLEKQQIDTEELTLDYWNKQNELLLVKQKTEYEINQKAKDDKIIQDKEAADKEIEIANEVQRQKEVIAAANLNLATKTVSLLSQLSGKSKALQKAGIIASAGIGIYSVIKDTQAANAAAIAPPPLGLGPIAGIGLQTKNTIGGALSIATIAAASAKALASVGGGGGGGGSVGGSIGGSAPTAPSFNLVAGTGSNQIAEGLAGQRQPLQAYVVSGAVTNAQQMQRNIVDDASL